MENLQFRAWDNFNACFYFSTAFLNLSCFFNHCQKCIDGGNALVFEQYIGLKAKTQVRVFDGDIIGGYEDNVFVVFYEPLRAKFHWKRIKGTANGEDTWFIILFSGSVIGNIHQDPKFLEG